MKWSITLLPNGSVEISALSEENGAVIECLPDGKITLEESTGYGSHLNFIGEFPSLGAAMQEGEKLA